MVMNLPPYCTNCAGNHWVVDCPKLTKPVTNKSTTPIKVSTTQVEEGTTLDNVSTTQKSKQARWNEKNREKFLGMKREYMRRKRGG